MIPALLLDCEQAEGGASVLMTRPDLGARVDARLMHELEQVELGRYRGLLLSMHVDQRYLLSRQAQLEAYLAGGGTILFCGHVGYPFLSLLQPFQPIQDYKVADLVVHRRLAHPIWDGVDPADLTLRRGVAGFYGRGSNPPPDGAEIIHVLGEAAVPVDWQHRLPGGGRLLVHAGIDLWSYAETGQSSARMVGNLIDWLERGAVA